mgnify:CR=1 FL=1
MINDEEELPELNQCITKDILSVYTVRLQY